MCACFHWCAQKHVWSKATINLSVLKCENKQYKSEQSTGAGSEIYKEWTQMLLRTMCVCVCFYKYGYS